MSHQTLRVSDEVKTPSNVITVIRILLVPVFVAVLLAPWPEWIGLDSVFSDSWKSIIAALIFIIISGTDWLDGYLARKRNEITDFGKFMDPLADKILVSAALICLVELGDLPTWVVLVILAREFIVSGVRMMAAARGEVIAASMIGKFKTVFQMIAIILFTIKGSFLVMSIGDEFYSALYIVSWIVMLIALGLTIASMIDYLVKAREFIGLGYVEKTANELLIDEVGEGLPEQAKNAELTIEELSALCIKLATEDGRTITTAESLTGGMIGQALTSVPGASNVFKGGVVSYTNEVKNRVLGVSAEDLKEVGAVSETVARQMAEGARKRLVSDYAIAVTGLAGPDADEFQNPVGTVWIALSTPESTSATKQHFDGDRAAIREKTTWFALRLTADALQRAARS